MSVEDQLPYLYKDQSEGAKKFTKNSFPIFSRPPMYLKFKSGDVWSEHDCVSILVGLFMVGPVYEKLKSRAVESTPLFDRDDEQRWIYDAIGLFERIHEILENAKAFGKLKYKKKGGKSDGFLFKLNIVYDGLEFIEYMVKENSFPIPSELYFFRSFDGSLKWVRKHAETSPGAMELADLFIQDENGILEKKDQKKFNPIKIQEIKQNQNFSKDIRSDLDDVISKYSPDLELFYRGLGGVIDIYFSGNKGNKKNTNREVIKETYEFLKEDLEFMTLEHAYKGSSPGENPSKEIKIPILKKMILDLSPITYARNLNICKSTERLYTHYNTIKKNV